MTLKENITMASNTTLLANSGIYTEKFHYESGKDIYLSL